MAHSGALTELPASILLPPTKSLFMITLDCCIVTDVIHQWLPCILQCRSSHPPSLWLSWSVGVWRMNILPFNSKTVRAIFFFWIFTLVMGAKYVVSILHNPMTYNRRSTMCKHVRRGGEWGGEDDARDNRIEGKPLLWSNKKGPTERVGFYGH